MKKNVIYFDIDGTVADARHRLHWIQSKPKNWPAFFKGIPDDSPIEPTLTVFHSLIKANHEIVFASGRSEQSRENTIDWLKKNGIYQDVHYLGLWMRKDGDYRSDEIVKAEILDEIEKEHHIMFAFDDRPRVVRMLRSRGVFVFDVYQGTEEF